MQARQHARAGGRPHERASQKREEQACSTHGSFRFFNAAVCLERDREVVGNAKTVFPPLDAT